MLAMAARTSPRAASAATVANRALTASASDAAVASSSRSPAGSPRSKRPRFVPPPLEQEVKAESEGYEANGEPYHRVSTPRYSLRRKVGSSSTNGIAGRETKVEQGLEDGKASISRVKKEKDLFATSPRKTSAKPIKLDLDPSEAVPAPKRWQEQYEVLIKQRKRIVAPVDTLGCEENGKDEKRQDLRLEESAEDKARRERFTLLISLMLSSQTKDPVTAEAVFNLQRSLPNGLCLDSILSASSEQISSNINKVGFWRRKTGYIQSAAQILRDDFDGDVPKTIDELCSLPGVGPKMGFLALQGAWGLNMGIGVDVHVHRVANRLKWVKSTDPEGTRLQLQSWLPKELHTTINKTLVGFGQVICQPVGPRCDLCALGAAKLCPSYRRVDPKSIASRVKVELLPEDEEGAAVQANGDGHQAATAVVKLEGPEGTGAMLVKQEDIAAIQQERLDW